MAQNKNEKLIIEAVADGGTWAVLGYALRDPETGEVVLHFDPRSRFATLLGEGDKLILHPDTD